MAVLGRTGVMVHIKRRAHSALRKRWPTLQFSAYNDHFVPDQDITLTLTLPAEVDCACAGAHAACSADERDVIGHSMVDSQDSTEAVATSAAMHWCATEWLEGFSFLRIPLAKPQKKMNESC